MAQQNTRPPMGLRLQQAAAVMRREFEAMSQGISPRQCGELSSALNMTQWRVLKTLSQTGSSTQRALHDATGIHLMTLSNICSKLEASNLVERKVDPNDSRAKQVSLTPEGRALMAKAKSASDAIHAKAFSNVPAEDIETTYRTLCAIIDNLGEATDQGDLK